MSLYLLKAITERTSSNGGVDIMPTVLAGSSRLEPLARLVVLLEKVPKPADSCSGQETDRWTKQVAEVLKAAGIPASLYPEWDVGIEDISFSVTSTYEII